MSDIAIRVENLSKLYHIGRAQRHDTLRDALSAAFGRSSAKMPRRHDADLCNDSLWALRDVSFDVQQGEVVGIIGRNGAGKSTLLKILSRITEPTTGRAEIHGRVGSLLEVGTGFHPELTGRENIYLNGAILGMRRIEIERKFDEIVAFSEIERFLDTPVKRYSSGMYVRLAFAVAAHLEPEILLVDEVLAVGDIAFQKKCLGKMGNVATEGRSVLFVSHNMVAVESLCSRAILIREGSTAESGDPRHVIQAYLAEGQRQVVHTEGVLAENAETGIALLGVSPIGSCGQELRFVKSGEDLRLAITIATSRAIPRLIASVGFNDLYSARVTVLHSDISGFELSVAKGTYTVICTVPKLPMVPGAYAMDVHLFSGVDSVLWAPGLGPLNVEAGDYYLRGKTPDSSWAGYYYLQQRWEVASQGL